MEVGWLARKVARQLGRSDCVVRRCWDRRIQEMSFTRRPNSRCPLQTNCQEKRHIVRKAHVQSTASSAAIQAQVSFSLGTSVSSRTIQTRLAEGHMGSWHPLPVLPLTPPIDASVWSGAANEETGLQRNGTKRSLETNPDSFSAVMTIVLVCGNLVVNASILPLLNIDTPHPQLV
ncbi:uncharacterized protein TNCV_1499281 [Trichonephila clavipes]|nr:uncharacterized protein TNCV_1499281 [Trichonephila clavipes]